MCDQPYLGEILDRHQIPWRTWGTDQSLTINNLAEQLDAGECELHLGENNQLIRVVFGVTIMIYCTYQGQRYRLMEEKQIFRDGRVRERGNTDYSVGEKKKRCEAPITAARRALAEELGITQYFDLNFRYVEERVKGPTESKSFPGLLTVFVSQHYTLELPVRFFNPNGYIEVQMEKDCYFIWVKEN